MGSPTMTIPVGIKTRPERLRRRFPVRTHLTNLLITTTIENNPAPIFIDGGSRISLCGIAVADRLSPMKLPARLLLALLVVGIGLFTVMPPGKVSLVVPQTSCYRNMDMQRCHGCLSHTTGTSSGLGSTCCAAQSGCCSLYFTRVTPFLTEMQLIGGVGISDEHATLRAQRPPVPPPRSVIS